MTPPWSPPIEDEFDLMVDAADAKIWLHDNGFQFNQRRDRWVHTSTGLAISSAFIDSIVNIPDAMRYVACELSLRLSDPPYTTQQQ